MRIELRHARLVAAVASAGSISKAAEQLQLPQPSITTQLRRIERTLGGDLFVRSRTGVIPTPLGDRLIPMLADLDRRGDAVIAEAAALFPAILRLGNVEWTPPTLRDAIQACLPAVDVQTESVDPQAALEAVRRGLLTAALVPETSEITRSEAAGPPLEQTVIVREPVWAALPKEHRLTSQRAVSSAQLATLEWVRYTREHWLHAVEERFFAGLPGPDPKVLHRAGGHHEAMSWVCDAGVAALTTPTGATRQVHLMPTQDPHRVKLLLVSRSGSISRADLDRIVETVRRYYCEYARSIPLYWQWIVDHPLEFAELRPFLPRTAPGRSLTLQAG
jgi:DNA-binding transcriptional LysR family regulator